MRHNPFTIITGRLKRWANLPALSDGLFYEYLSATKGRLKKYDYPPFRQPVIAACLLAMPSERKIGQHPQSLLQNTDPDGLVCNTA